jgi:hypothetical protein
MGSQMNIKHEAKLLYPNYLLPDLSSSVGALLSELGFQSQSKQT